MNTDAVIVADRLTRRFGSFTAVDAISFDARRGEIFGFLGANGAGKTTAIKMMSGLRMPSEGTAVVGGAVVVGDGIVLTLDVVMGGDVTVTWLTHTSWHSSFDSKRFPFPP